MNIKENIKTLIIEKPLKLDCGKTIKNFPLAYETYGLLTIKVFMFFSVFIVLTVLNCEKKNYFSGFF